MNTLETIMVIVLVAVVIFLTFRFPDSFFERRDK